jgi:hypothetical protein
LGVVARVLRGNEGVEKGDGIRRGCMKKEKKRNNPFFV